MNLQRLPEYFVRGTVIVLGILVPIYLVKSATQGGMGKLVLAGVLCAFIAATLIARERIWFAVPLTWGLSGTIPALGLPVQLRYFVLALVVVACFALIALKLIKRKPIYDLRSTLIVVMLLYLAIAWIRNPVGVAYFESERVGGRPYFDCLMGVAAYWVLSRSAVRPQVATLVVVVLSLANSTDGLISQLLNWIPGFTPFFEQYYSGGVVVEKAEQMSANSAIEGDQRQMYLATLGSPLALGLAAAMRPLSALNIAKPWRPLILCLSLAAILFSGFRSAFVVTALLFLLSSYYWGGAREVFKMVMIGLVCVVFAVLAQGTFLQLPKSVQRTLSFLPGRWDYDTIANAQHSVTWRLEMWEEMLTTNRYITDKVFGDGFGFKKRDLELIAYYSLYGDGREGQENFMISGQVHSGPISAIRYVGYVGLGLLLLILIAISMYAWKLMWVAREGPYKILGFFLCAPVIVNSIAYVFIFGAFESFMPMVLFQLGMLRVLHNSINDYQEEAQEEPLVPELALDSEETRSLGARRLKS